MVDAAIIATAYVIGAAGFWRNACFSNPAAKAAFASFWPISFLWLLVRGLFL